MPQRHEGIGHNMRLCSARHLVRMGIDDLTEIVEGAQVVMGNAIACRIHAADLPLRGQVPLIGRVLESGKRLRFVAAVQLPGISPSDCFSPHLPWCSRYS